MQHYQFTVQPNTTFPMNVAGKYVYFLEGFAGGLDTTVVIKRGAGSDSVLLRPGQAVRLPLSPDRDTNWIITSYKKEGPITGTLLIGDGEFFDNRISGSVEVIDSSKNKTMAGRSFWRFRRQIADAANYSVIQAFNPLDSGKNFAFTKIMLASEAAGAQVWVYVGQTDATPGSPAFMMNKKLGGPDGLVRMTAIPAAAQPAAQIGAVIGAGSVRLPTDQSYVNLPMETPIVVPPGYGITLQTDAVNQGLFTFWECEEFQ